MQNVDSVFDILNHLSLTQFLLRKISASMSKPSTRNSGNERTENEKVPTLVVKRIREAILDEVFKPGDT
jgi:hypothetical protein